MTITHIAGRTANGRRFLLPITSAPISAEQLEVARQGLLFSMTQSLGEPPRVALIAIQGGKQP